MRDIKGQWGGPSRQSATLAVFSDVADCMAMLAAKELIESTFFVPALSDG